MISAKRNNYFSLLLEQKNVQSRKKKAKVL